MTIVFASSEDIDFTLIEGDWSMSTSFRDANYARTSIRTDGVANDRWGCSFAELSTFYISWQHGFQNATSSGNDSPMFVMKDGDVEVARIGMSNGNVRNQNADGLGAWINTQEWPSRFVTGPRRVTCKLVLHATNGEFTTWYDNVQQATFLGDTIELTGASAIDNVYWNVAGLTAIQYVSEVVVADVHTINMRVSTHAPTADGNATDWTGDWSDVDENDESAADTLSSDSADDVETMNLADYAGDTTLVVLDLFVSASAVRGAIGPQNLQLMVRENVSEAFSSNNVLTDVFTTYTQSFPVNPDTSAAWTISELDTMQAGVKSIT